MRKNVLLLTALSIAATATTFAADAPTTPTAATPVNAPRIEKSGAKMREKFEAADTDHDGFLSRDETAKGMPHLAKRFDAIDTDHDGKLSMQEIAQFLRNRRAARNETP